MRTAGWILIAIGIIMVVIRGFNVPVTKKVVDIGPVEVNKTENTWVGWPTYAGGALAVIGIIMVAAGGRKEA